MYLKIKSGITFRGQRLKYKRNRGGGGFRRVHCYIKSEEKNKTENSSFIDNYMPKLSSKK